MNLLPHKTTGISLVSETYTICNILYMC